MPTFTTFDPYYKWLGIPRSEQPPNHYRLLGLNLYESDLEVIESAADQRMDYLRTFQNGPCVEQSQQLLNQVAAARVCLLNSQRKCEYDNGLRLRMAGGVPPSMRFGQIAALFPLPPGGAFRPNVANPTVGYVCASAAAELPATPAPTCLGIRENSDSLAAGVASTEATDAVELDELGINAPLTHFPKKPTMPLAVWLTGPVIAILLVVVVIMIADKLQENANEPRNSTKPDAATAATANRGHATQLLRQKSAAQGYQPAASRPFIVDPRPQDSRPPSQTIDDEPSNPLIESPPSPVPEAATSAAAAGSANAALPADSPTRLPVPTADAQERALREIHDVMREEFAAAQAAVGQRTLARKLEELAADTVDDPATRYTLLAQALESAVRGGDAQFADAIVNRLGTFYDVDIWQLRSETSPRLFETVSTVEGRTTLVEQTIELIERAINDDRYDVAAQLVELATMAASALDNQSLEARVKSRADKLIREQAADTKANQALDRLQIQPNDPAANLVVGKFRCFDKQDWQSGLRFLVRGGDLELQQLARQELTEPQTSLDQMKLANSWWDLAERMGEGQGEPARQSIRNHAVHWYREALPHLSGLALLKAQKRIAEQHPNP